MFAKMPEGLRAALARGATATDKRLIAPLRRRSLKRAEQRRFAWIIQIGHQRAQKMRAPAREPARGDVTAIIQFTRGPFDLCSSRGADVNGAAARVEHR